MQSSGSRAVKKHKKRSENDIIASLDPLNADDLILKVPELNESKDVNGLISLAGAMMPSLKTLKRLNYFQANAAIRDIGIMLGSLKRHHIEPVAVIPGLEETMALLASKTAMPPRDTLLHYTVWNPTDHRRRTYTGTRDEHCLIDSVVMALGPLVRGIELLKQLHATPLESEHFQQTCEEVTVQFQKVIDGMVLARRKVCLSYFASELRLYFDPIQLNGREYLGPGAVEMPMFVFDHLLWSCDCDDAAYEVFKQTYLPYVHPEMRAIFHEFQDQASLLGKCYHLIVRRHINFHPVVYQSLCALRHCFQQLKSFRMPHKKVAEEAYAHAAGASGSPDEPEHGDAYRSNGSGGYSPGVLSHIVDLTNKKAAMLDACISFYQLKIRK